MVEDFVGYAAADRNLAVTFSGVQQTVTAFENEVNANYTAYWQLIKHGSVVNGVFTLESAPGQGTVLHVFLWGRRSA